MRGALVQRADVEAIARRIRDVPDFPKPGIVFKDITPLLLDPDAFRGAVELMTAPFRGARISRVVSIESRGFLLGAPVALGLEAGLVPMRKPGKLPAERGRVEYALERSEEHTSELQSRGHLVCRLLLEKKKEVTTLRSSRLLS